jgi:hypothetical protein
MRLCLCEWCGTVYHAPEGLSCCLPSVGPNYSLDHSYSWLTQERMGLWYPRTLLKLYIRWCTARSFIYNAPAYWRNFFFFFFYKCQRRGDVPPPVVEDRLKPKWTNKFRSDKETFQKTKWLPRRVYSAPNLDFGTPFKNQLEFFNLDNRLKGYGHFYIVVVKNWFLPNILPISQQQI